MAGKNSRGVLFRDHIFQDGKKSNGNKGSFCKMNFLDMAPQPSRPALRYMHHESFGSFRIYDLPLQAVSYLGIEMLGYDQTSITLVRDL